MTFKIFTVEDDFVEVDIGQKEVDFMVVTILQGGEIIQVYFKDGTSVEINQQLVFNIRSRTSIWYDGVYVVMSDKLKEWADIGNSSDNPIFTRLNNFSDIDSVDDLNGTINGVKIAQSKRKHRRTGIDYSIK